MAKQAEQQKARDTAAEHRALQRETARQDKHHPPQKADEAMQAGARVYPEPPFPK